MQAVWLCISSCRPFEDTFDKAHLRKVGQMQPMCRVWRVPATLPYPDFFFTTRTLPGIFLKISGFRVVSKYHFQCRIISMTLISRGKWPFTRLINFQNFPHPSDRKTFVTKWSMGFPQQLNTTIIIWRSAATSPDILVVVMMMAIPILLICKILIDSRDLRYPQPYPLPGFFPTTLPEPYPKSKSPTRQSLPMWLCHLG